MTEAEAATRFAARSLPPGYQPSGIFDIAHNVRLVVVMNLLGIFLLFVFGWFFLALVQLVRPGGLSGLTFSATGLGDLLGQLGIFGGVVVGVIVLHEAAHGLFFWLFTGTTPVFAFKGYYASASAPGWYFKRNPYLVIGLAPLVLLSAVGTALLAVVPGGWLIPLLLFLIFNASGAVGDLMVVIWLLTKPASARILDLPESIKVYLPLPDEPLNR